MRWIRAALNWLVDQAIEHWVTILSVTGGIVMTYLASISGWLSTYGPVAWGAIGLMTGLVVSVIFFLVGVARMKIVTSGYVNKNAQTASINPLAKRFEKQKLRLADFFHPFYQPNENVKFEECELLGPSHILMTDCYIIHCKFFNCETVIVKENCRIVGVTLFKGCSLDNCKLFNITLYITKTQFHQSKASGWEYPNVISDGTAGNC